MATRRGHITGLAKLVAGTLLLLLALTLLLDQAGKTVLRHSDFRLSRIAQGGTHLHMLVAGNSRGVNLAAGQADIFNLSFNGLGGKSVLALVQDFYAAGNSVDVVVIEASSLLNPSGNCELKPYWGVLPALTAATRPACATDDWMAHWFPLTLYDSELFQRAAYYLVAHHDQAWTNESEMTGAACTNPPVRQIDNFTAQPSPARAAEIRNQLGVLQAWLAAHHKNVRVVLVLAPFTAPQALPRIAAVRNALTTALGKDSFLDLGAALPPQCSLFADPLHLNRAGRDAVRQRILDYAR